ncbi:hypothetical protein [Promicromonospora iranensis]|jgi:hypothetical protein|uniref:hypothetical protein n=1 Tax=Promicromonospora iranensis TaxID=1105144 RepID=UPI0023A97AAF|nr:hypothetical protein [Promicromonospora iranensis]
MDDNQNRPLSELRRGENVYATVTGHHPWGLTAEIHGFQSVGASLDVIRRGREPGVRLLRKKLPPVGVTVELVIGAVRPWHHEPWVWVDLTAVPPPSASLARVR